MPLSEFPGLLMFPYGALADGTGTVAPVLSAASSGTPTSDGCTGAGVTTDTGNGTLYWAVVTNGGSCTDAQLKAGAGGNIVAGKAGSQAVSSSGAQSISTITGLTASTTYQIKYLQTNASAQDSSQASVSLTTSAGYATLNPSDKGANIALSGGNLIATKSAAGWNSVRATLGKTSGKWYFEITYTTVAASANAMAAVSDGASSTGSYFGGTALSYGYNAALGQKYNNGSSAAYGSTWGAGDVIGVALDMDNGKVFFAKNNVWQNSGDPVAGTNAAYTGLTGTVYPGLSEIGAGDVLTVNFGASAFTYTPPTGFVGVQ